MPALYTIPAGRMVPANGYLVLLADDDGNPSTIPGPDFFGSKFSLSSVGEDIYLSAGDGASFLGYSEAVQFNGSLDGQSLGRFPNGASDFFFPMTNQTFGMANSTPQLGDVIITEIMYHPPTAGGGGDPDLLEFVEIQNMSNMTVDLSGGAIDGIKYVFPPGTSIEPAGVRVVVPFDPVADTTAIANFNAAYGVDIAASQQQYLGASLGKLSNSGERVTLFSAGTPPAGTFIAPLLFEDGVKYSDTVPWPSRPDGSGDSLNRTSATAFGDFAASWMSAAPTPGRSPFVTQVDGDMDTDGDLDFDDIPPLVTAIRNPVAYESQYGVAPAVHGDFDGDGDLDFDDIPGFVAALAGTRQVAATAAVPASMPEAPFTMTSRDLSNPLLTGTVSQANVATSEPVNDVPVNESPPPDRVTQRSASGRIRQRGIEPFHTVRWAHSDAERDAVWNDGWNVMRDLEHASIGGGV